MANYKNRKPKTYKGHCHMCSCQCTDGTRNGRLLTPDEVRAKLRENEGKLEYEEA